VRRTYCCRCCISQTCAYLATVYDVGAISYWPTFRNVFTWTVCQLMRRRCSDNELVSSARYQFRYSSSWRRTLVSRPADEMTLNDFWLIIFKPVLSKLLVANVNENKMVLMFIFYISILCWTLMTEISWEVCVLDQVTRLLLTMLLRNTDMNYFSFHFVKHLAPNIWSVSKFYISARGMWVLIY
jgi:hypothetical protein